MKKAGNFPLLKNRTVSGPEQALPRCGRLSSIISIISRGVRRNWPVPNDWYMAVAYTVRDRMLDCFLNVLHGLSRPEVKFVSYLSAEFLMGPHLGNNLLNLGITEQMRAALQELGLELDDCFLNQEEEPGLGNGGLGRLAACYMDSLATLDVLAPSATASAMSSASLTRRSWTAGRLKKRTNGSAWATRGRSADPNFPAP